MTSEPSTVDTPLKKLVGEKTGKALASHLDLHTAGGEAVVQAREHVLGFGAAVHVDPPGGVTQHDGDDGVGQVVPAHDRPRSRPDDPAVPVDDRQLLLAIRRHVGRSCHPRA